MTDDKKPKEVKTQAFLHDTEVEIGVGVYEGGVAIDFFEPTTVLVFTAEVARKFAAEILEFADAAEREAADEATKH